MTTRRSKLLTQSLNRKRMRCRKRKLVKALTIKDPPGGGKLACRMRWEFGIAFMTFANKLFFMDGTIWQI